MTTPFFPSKKPHVFRASLEGGTATNTNMQMPNVFVVPPEEDETPAWCFFDADNPALSQVVERPETPDITILAFPSDNDTPVFSRNSPGSIDSAIMPRRSLESISVVEALMNHEAHGDDDSDNDSGFGRDSRDERHTNLRDAADDSDVIEVVKVNERQSLQAFSEYKRSVTLKSRASKVFKSLKGSLRSSKPRAQDIFPSVPSSIQITQTAERTPQETLPRPRTPTISRRGSRILSQYASSFTSPSSSAPNSILSNPLSRRPSLYSAEAQDEARLQAASPTPTTSSSKSSSRFSILNLQKLFSFSPPAPSSTVPVATPFAFPDSGATPALRSSSCTPRSDASSVSTSAPQTPTSTEEVTPVRLVSRKDTADFPAFNSFESVFDANGGLNLGLGLGLSLDSTSSSGSQQTTPRKSFGSSSTISSWGSITPKRFSKAPIRRSQGHDDDGDEGDTSLEMRLDSLHFDSLSFDAD
ncbi:hypothetical protein BDZ97DRAFT_1814926, partial [Flammula alnicola]